MSDWREKYQLAAWIPDGTDQKVIDVIQRALTDVGIVELSPNRSGRIDEYNTRAGAAVGSFWCASGLFCWWQDAGLETPRKWLAPSCDEWVKWAKATGRWADYPVLGAAVVYGKKTPFDANHIGQVVRLFPQELSVEGNTSLEKFDRNGTAVDLKRVAKERVLGYVHPFPIT